MLIKIFTSLVFMSRRVNLCISWSLLSCSQVVDHGVRSKGKTLEKKWSYGKGFSGYYLQLKLYSFWLLHIRKMAVQKLETGWTLSQRERTKCKQACNLRFCSLVSLTVCSQSFVNSEEVTRDYLPQIKEPIMRECCLLPWFPEKLTDKEWIDKLSNKTTLEGVRKELSALQMKVCSFSISGIF